MLFTLTTFDIPNNKNKNKMRNIEIIKAEIIKAEIIKAKIKQVKIRMQFATLNETKLLLSALDFYYTEL